jgi:hypothetical protein
MGSDPRFYRSGFEASGKSFGYAEILVDLGIRFACCFWRINGADEKSTALLF